MKVKKYIIPKIRVKKLKKTLFFTSKSNNEFLELLVTDSFLAGTRYGRSGFVCFC